MEVQPSYVLAGAGLAMRPAVGKFSEIIEECNVVAYYQNLTPLRDKL